jgi:hypothetical protein
MKNVRKMFMMTIYPCPKPEKKKKKYDYDYDKVKRMFTEKCITRCELCNTDSWLSFAHRNKRNWYKGKDKDLINSFDQILLLCVPKCHLKLEQDAKLTEETFKRLRG